MRIDWLTGRTDVVHGPNFVVAPDRRGAEVLTVHDLTPCGSRRCARSTCWPTRRSSAGRSTEAAWIHTVSRVRGRARCATRSRSPSDAVVAVPNGVTHRSPDGPGRDAAAGRRVLAGAERYVLAVGTVEPRKDLPTLVAAFDALAATTPTCGW